METVGSGGGRHLMFISTLNIHIPYMHTHACIHACIHDTHMYTHTQKRKNEEKNIYTYSINAISFPNIFDLK